MVHGGNVPPASATSKRDNLHAPLTFEREVLYRNDFTSRYWNPHPMRSTTSADAPVSSLSGGGESSVEQLARTRSRRPFRRVSDMAANATHGYIIGNYLQATDQDIRDFFWTGSGDGPGSVLNPFERFPISEDAIIKTATVVATVYIDRNGGRDGYDDLCIFDCPPSTGHRDPDRSDDGDDTFETDQAHGIDNVTPTDRRFWLMTVIGGLHGRHDYPMLETKLAKLYRVAFARQQALHLGINSSTSNGRQQQEHQQLEEENGIERQPVDESNSSVDSEPRHRLRRQAAPPDPERRPNKAGTSAKHSKAMKRGKSATTTTGKKLESSIRPPSASSSFGHSVLTNGYVVAYEQRLKHRNRNHRGPSSSSSSSSSSSVRHKRDFSETDRTGSQVLPVPPIVEVIGADGPEGGLASGDGSDEQLRSQRSDNGRHEAPDKDAYSTTGGRRKVRILIHNTTHLREEDRLSMESSGGRDTSNRAGSHANDGGVGGTSNQLLNQTEIIYSVFVGGLPVLATTAAEDMKLMSQEEMEHVLESMVYLKADPYLKEPQATPLIPSTQNGSGNVIALIGQNPSLFIVSCVAAVLLLILCIGMFLLARGKRKHIVALKKLESTQALVMPGTIAEELNALKTGDSGSSRQPSPSYPRDPSSATVSLMAQKPSPTIHFPLPPMTRPTSSSSSYSSDCSVYYPKRKQKHQQQQQQQQQHHHHHHHHHHQQQQQQLQQYHHHELLDEKSVNLTNKLQKQFHLQSLLPPGQENVYASVQKPLGKKDHKRRRKYLGENRVGSIEGGGVGGMALQPPLPPPRSPLTTTTASSASPSDHSATFADDRQPKLVPGAYEPSETYNTDVIMKHYLKRKPLTGVGGLPVEALNRDRIRVLAEQYNGIDSGSIGSYLSMASVKSFPRCFVPEPLSRVLEPVTMTHLDQSDVYADGVKSSGPDTAATSQYNTDTEVHLARSQSDGADPGVVGPIVWQMHKKEMEEITSPLRDPVVTRNRFEGLLEGAIQLYEEEEGPEREEEQKNSIPLPGVIRPCETRGKSALVVRETSRASSATIRPVTAAPGRKVDHSHDHHLAPGSPMPHGGRGGPGGGAGAGAAWSSGTHSPMVRPMSAGPFHSPQSGPTVGIEIAQVTAPHSVLQSTELSTAPLLQNIMQELQRFRNEQ
ncbi:hypothetical protein AND_002319 [Anopheles darlingi]|uniref:Uncharacterized protein n=1 Tax=Anopheles darlingi TaxID=43151 RepID=W5JRK1_ANODA|nr:hypothetical protein AND_002319 [Anopheles darlingi]